MSVWKAIYVSSWTFRVTNFGRNQKFLTLGNEQPVFSYLAKFFSRVVRTAFHVSGEKLWGKRSQFSKFFLFLKEEVSTFWEKTPPACQTWILRIQKNQQKFGRTVKALCVSSGTIGGKMFGRNQKFWTFGH